MRILRIRILNINSLRGEHVIDFTEAPLSNHQLYAIVGPTGSGKTTILDAITLALYGQTDRNPASIAGSDLAETVMTYGAEECAAELDFETATGRYRSSWKAHRAHRKPEGKMQNPKPSIGRIDPVSDESTPIFEKHGQVKQLTTEIIGLDYDRFVRSVMLTQGQFARFLKSNIREKGQILEKITGTDIYRELSIAAFQRHKIAREAYQRESEALDADPALPPEHRAELEATLIALDAELKDQSNELATTQNAMTAHQKLLDLQGKLERAHNEQAELQVIWQQLAPDRARLAAGDKVRELRSALDAKSRLSTERSQLDALIAAQQTQADRISKLSIACKDSATRAASHLHAFERSAPIREEAIKKADAQETTLNQLKGEFRGLNAQYLTLTEEAAQLERDIATQQSLITELSSRAGNLDAILLEQQANELTTKLAECRKTERTLEVWSLHRRLSDKIAELQLESERLAAAITRRERAKLSVQEQVALAKRQVKVQMQKIDLLNRQASLSQHRALLEHGQPCPLCGSKEHPLNQHTNPTTDNALTVARAEAEELEQQLGAAEKELLLATEHARSSRQGQQTVLKQINDLKVERDELPNPPDGEQRSLAELQDDKARSAEHIKQLERELAQIDRYRKVLPKLIEARSALKSKLSRKETVSKELVEVDRGRRSAEEKRTAAQTGIQKLIPGYETSQLARTALTNERQRLVEASNIAETALLQCTSRQDQATAKLQDLSDRRAATHTELNDVEQALVTALAAKGLNEAEARSSMLTMAEEQTLRQKINGAERARAAVAKTVADLAKEQVTQTAQVAELPDLRTLTDKAGELVEQMDKGKEDRGRRKQQIDEDDRRLAKNAAAQSRLQGLLQEENRWGAIADLIGSSDGKLFRSYAQAITLQRLIDIGNQHLERMSDRYFMEYDPPQAGQEEGLNIIIIDRYQNDNQRTMATLSGGESFVVSLALALGLSDLASGRSLIETLFIDEGFGTLDGDTLNKAMTALEQLRSQGKTIGLISHVPQLRERIQCQLVLKPVGDGYSKIVAID